MDAMGTVPQARLRCSAYSFGSTSRKSRSVHSRVARRLSNVDLNSYTGFRPGDANRIRAGKLFGVWRGAARRVSVPCARKTTGPIVAMFEKFTESAITVMLFSQKAAKKLGHSEVCTFHIFLGLVEEDVNNKGFIGKVATLEQTRAAVESVVGKKTARDTAQDIPFSRDTKEILVMAESEAERMGGQYVSKDHLVMAMMSKPSPTMRKIFDRLGIRPDHLKALAQKNIIGDQAFDRAEAPAAKPQKKTKSVSPAKSGKDKKEGSVLEDFARDLCAAAEEGRIDPVIGRSKEVGRVIEILARRRKNNPILLGEAGVGKTAIAEGLACALVSKRGPNGNPIPEFLVGKRVMQLDVALLMAGAKERGEMEQRVTSLIAEMRENRNVILMIDEIHTLVGAGAIGRSGLGSGGLDIANLFKPALARGELQCVGATTLDEFTKYVESDKALARRFQPVFVDEPTSDQAVSILKGLRGSYEKHHHCLFTEEALDAAVQLSCRYIADRFLPDKAIDVLDEAGSRARIAGFNARKENPGYDEKFAQDIWEELSQVIDAKDDAIQEGLFEEATLLRARETDLKAQIAGSPDNPNTVVPVVDVEDIEAVVAAWSGVPIEKLSTNESNKIVRLESSLREKVIGQEAAVSAVARAMQRAYSLIRDPKRPIASFLFCGPTGVGKTELTKVLADECFSSRDDIIRFDMSEYMERHSVSKLVGAPPGYVGYGGGGKLTEAVRRKPFSVVLFDEVEKAHPDVFNLFLQLLEDGCLTDSKGRTVSFRNAVVIMTSNLGSNVIAKGGGQIGFQLEDDVEASNYSRIKTLVKEELKSYFRPEMLNRIDEIVVFQQLSVADIHEIAEIILREAADRLQTLGIRLQVTMALKDKVCKEGYDKSYGARPLRREITRLVDDVLCDAILHKKLKEGDTAIVDVGHGGDVVLRSPEELQLSQTDLNDVVVCPEIRSVEANVEA